MTNVLTLDQYRRWVADYLDALERQTEINDEEQVLLVGNISGSADVRAPNQSNDQKRIKTTVGYDTAAFDDESGVAPLDDVMTTGGRRRLFGTVAVPRSCLSDEAEETIAAQQAEIDEIYAAEGRDSE